jgi:hypothetical protein
MEPAESRQREKVGREGSSFDLPVHRPGSKHTLRYTGGVRSVPAKRELVDTMGWQGDSRQIGTCKVDVGGINYTRVVHDGSKMK